MAYYLHNAVVLVRLEGDAHVYVYNSNRIHARLDEVDEMQAHLVF